MDKRATIRSEIHPGQHVAIVLKKDQPTGRLTEGTVKRILTNSQEHPRGIKVMLQENDMVGRVQLILDGNKEEVQPGREKILGGGDSWFSHICK